MLLYFGEKFAPGMITAPEATIDRIFEVVNAFDTYNMAYPGTEEDQDG